MVCCCAESENAEVDERSVIHEATCGGMPGGEADIIEADAKETFKVARSPVRRRARKGTTSSASERRSERRDFRIKFATWGVESGGGSKDTAVVGLV